ncbi:hypothetical protein OG252_24610 [Streptomyces sp. NBC_01352]|uniref:hypothetical protein n=1 Tax=Streptomyces sp. NBC_01352 TaxID=2903834 RepID=UPI002E322E00|nr:hypothetical protein [Streptomyces sp. NBC_01352]
MIVLVESGLKYFEDHDLPKGIDREDKVPWLLVKLGGDGMLDRNDKLHRALTQRRDKVIVVTTADDLRRVPGTKISRSTAWDLEASDCARVFRTQDRLNQYRFVVVSFGPAGALLFDREANDDARLRLFYDASTVEGSSDFWLNGRMWGYTSALTAAICRKILTSWEDDASLVVGNAVMNDGVRRGIGAMQRIYDAGFGPISDDDALCFPVAEVGAAINGTASGRVAEVPVDREAGSSWTVLNASPRRLDEIAHEIVYKGVEKALEVTKVPHLKYGRVVTVDRREIESYQSVRSLVKDYVERRGTRVRNYWEMQQARTPVPLSIAIFGQPGSGKSTAVREIIGSLKIQDRELKIEEFNLSQFRGTSELIDSFHLLRDHRLRGRVPVVLWDEFDTDFDGTLGWLRYFLSPMQDGSFQQGQAVHPIGRSVFVFAGGVASTLDEFKNLGSAEEFNPAKGSTEEFKLAKGPDFLSRVRGTMELQGIDKRDDDPLWVLRRAILLRSILQSETHLFDGHEDGVSAIDADVLNAFLGVEKFSHGVRSLRAIVVNSSLAGEYYYSKSSLPNETQLNLHVKSGEFYAAMKEKWYESV